MSFSDYAEQVQITGINANLMPGSYYGQSLSRVITVTEPTLIEFGVFVKYSMNGASFYVNNEDDKYIRFTATLLSAPWFFYFVHDI